MADRWIAALLVCGIVVLRVLYAGHFRIDSDEPQHLHVVWAWATGQLPYRDVFDNHAPLFQALCAPLFHFLGVRPDILIPMRLAMVPLFAGTAWCVWKAAASLFSPRVALWTALLAALFPPFFLTSIEFRPDQLWALLWLAALAVLVTGRATPWRAFAGGVLLGTAFGVSMKSSLLLFSLALALAGGLLLRRWAGAPIPWKRLGLCAAAGLAGLALVPAGIVVYFVAQGAGREMLYCVIQHNIVPHQSHGGQFLRWLGRLALLALGVAGISRLRLSLQARVRIAFLFLAANGFYFTLNCFWPILTAEDYLPFFPVWMLTAGPLSLWIAGWAGKRMRLPAAAIPTVFALMEIGLFVRAQSPLDNQTEDKIGMVANGLKLTEPTDYVMDSKGELIYRHRPYRFVLEGLTLRRLRGGLIKNDLPERLIATQTPLVATLQRMPGRGKEFIGANYIPIAYRLYVLGKFLCPDAVGTVHFAVAVPGRYTLVSNGGQPAGLLDGTPFIGPRELVAGPHEFRDANGDRKLALVWARAVERGFSPFADIKPEGKTPQD